MHTELGDDILPPVIKVVVALGEGAAVCAQVRPNGPYGPVDIGDKRPFSRGVSEDMATTIIGPKRDWCRSKDSPSGISAVICRESVTHRQRNGGCSLRLQ